jgi:phosphoribosylformylglycinamidine cyclo-ligase
MNQIPGSPSSELTYKAAGVDIDEGARLVGLIGPAAKATARPGADGALGGFAGAFDLKAAGYHDPILLLSTDGVGTKLKIAIDTGLHDGIGVDLVAMVVNDLLAQGGEPLMFLDYYACGKLNADAAAAVIKGIARGCLESGCALGGGETAEMPGLYKAGDYDLAGFAVGAAERGALLPKLDAVQPGDALIGVASSGPHSNGYSLIRKIVERTGLPWDVPAPFAPRQNLGEALLTPTRLYVNTLLPILRSGLVHGGAHITGGGLTENTPRALPDHLSAAIDYSAWPRPPVFAWLQEAGGVPEEDLRRTFNCGIGFVLVAPQANVAAVLERLAAAGETAWVIGAVAA